MYSVAEKSKRAADPAIESLDKHECKIETTTGQPGKREEAEKTYNVKYAMRRESFSQRIS